MDQPSGAQSNIPLEHRMGVQHNSNSGNEEEAEEAAGPPYQDWGKKTLRWLNPPVPPLHLNHYLMQ